MKYIKEYFSFTNEKVICSKCNWSWDLSDGGDDPYTCHKCGNINKEEDINKYLSISSFDNLPHEYKKSIIIYTLEGDLIDWSTENYEDFTTLINDYSKLYGNRKFEYGEIPKEIVIKRIWEDEDLSDSYKNFNDYHKAYQSTNEADHGNSIIPIIVSDDNSEYIDDGWHRFHFYINKGYKFIPVIKYLNINNESVRNNYQKFGSPSNYYKSEKEKYTNPHIDKIEKCLDITSEKIDIGYFLDLGCGNGEVSKYLQSNGYNRFKGCDPYFDNIYRKNLNKDCLKMSFEDISKKGIDDKFDTIICSYSIHLCDKSYFNNLLYQLSTICSNLVIISPSKYPEIDNNYFDMEYSNIVERTHLRIYSSKND